MTKGNSVALPGDGERIYARLVSGVSRALNKMLREEHAISGLNRAAVADIMGVDKGFVSRKLSGSNMTLRTISAFLAAAGWEMDVSVHRVAPPSRASNREPSPAARYAISSFPASFILTFEDKVGMNQTGSFGKTKALVFDGAE